MIVGFLTMFAGQMTGTLLINNYGPELYKSLGYGSADQLIIAGGWITVALPSNAINAYFLDRLGRTRFLAIGLTGDAVALLGETIMLTLFEGTNNSGGLGAAVFFLFLHVAFYALCIDASTYVYGSEIWPTHLRAKDFAVSIAGLFFDRGPVCWIPDSPGLGTNGVCEHPVAFLHCDVGLHSNLRSRCNSLFSRGESSDTPRLLELQYRAR